MRCLWLGSAFFRLKLLSFAHPDCVAENPVHHVCWFKECFRPRLRCSAAYGDGTEMGKAWCYFSQLVSLLLRHQGRGSLETGSDTCVSFRHSGQRVRSVVGGDRKGPGSNAGNHADVCYSQKQTGHHHRPGQTWKCRGQVHGAVRYIKLSHNHSRLNPQRPCTNITTSVST